MSYTNQTQHYGLPQYVGTDVPAWLTDINGAFAAIDTGMNAAKTQADSAATAAGQAANDIAALTTTVNAQAAQISAAAQAASNAQTTANTADGKADALDTRVAALESDSVSFVNYTFTGDATTQLGSTGFYVTPILNNAIQSVLPADKTIADITNIHVKSATTFVIPATSYGGTTDAIVLMFLGSRPNSVVELVITVK